MKLKNFLIESTYFPGMLIATWLTVSSCVAHAQVASDSTLGALNPANGLRVGEYAKAWQWDATKWENAIVTPPPIRGDSLFIDGSTFVLLQRLNKHKFGWVTYSIKWVVTDTTFEGNCKCEHSWIYSKNKNLTFRVGATVWRKTDGLALCSVGTHSWKRFWDEPDHDEGSHCPYEVNEREKICRYLECLRSVIEREKWYQHFIAPPKSEFERLKEKQRAKK